MRYPHLHHLLRPQPQQRLPTKNNLPPPHPHNPRYRPQQRSLARPVGPHQRHHSPLIHMKGQIPYRLNIPIKDVHAPHFKQVPLQDTPQSPSDFSLPPQASHPLSSTHNPIPLPDHKNPTPHPPYALSITPTPHAPPSPA